jgi:hypothetical protein
LFIIFHDFYDFQCSHVGSCRTISGVQFPP